MVCLRLASIAAVSLAVAGFGPSFFADAANAPASTATIVDCLAAVNAKRVSVGFPELVVFTTTDTKYSSYTTNPETNAKAPLTEVCASAGTVRRLVSRGATESPNPTLFTNNRQFAWFPAATATATYPTCDEALAVVNKAIANFKSAPPKLSVTEELYKSSDNVALVALLSPTVTKLDCASYTCAAPLTGNPGLACQTIPHLKDKAPFTEEQWATVVKSSASIAVPSVLAFAAAAVSLTFF